MEQIQNLKVGQKLRLTLKDSIPGCFFEGIVEVTGIESRYHKCWVKVVKVIRKGMVNLWVDTNTLVDFDQLSFV